MKGNLQNILAFNSLCFGNHFKDTKSNLLKDFHTKDTINCSSFFIFIFVEDAPRTSQVFAFWIEFDFHHLARKFQFASCSFRLNCPSRDLNHISFGNETGKLPEPLEDHEQIHYPYHIQMLRELHNHDANFTTVLWNIKITSTFPSVEYRRFLTKVRQVLQPWHDAPSAPPPAETLSPVDGVGTLHPIVSKVCTLSGIFGKRLL